MRRAFDKKERGTSSSGPMAAPECMPIMQSSAVTAAQDSDKGLSACAGPPNSYGRHWPKRGMGVFNAAGGIGGANPHGAAIHEIFEP